MPAQVVAAAVAMPSDTRSQPPDLGHQARPVKSLKVRIQILAHLPILAGTRSLAPAISPPRAPDMMGTAPPRSISGMSGRSLRVLAMHKHTGLAAACSAVVGSPTVQGAPDNRAPSRRYARTSGRYRTRRWPSRSGHRVRVRRRRPAAARWGPGHPDGSQPACRLSRAACLISVGWRTGPSGPKDAEP
jgi:hypothetical protein